MENKKNIIIFSAITLILVGGSFFGGTKYSESKNKSKYTDFFNMTQEQRQKILSENGNGLTRQNGRAQIDFFNGEISSMDGDSITLKLKDGNSKMILISDKTEILKTIKGDKEDLTVGINISINGTQDPTGVISATNIQIKDSTNKDLSLTRVDF